MPNASLQISWLMTLLVTAGQCFPDLISTMMSTDLAIQQSYTTAPCMCLVVSIVSFSVTSWYSPQNSVKHTGVKLLV